MNDNRTSYGELLAGRCSKISTHGSSLFLIISVMAFGAFFLWASFTKLDRVTRGSGRVVSQEKNNFVQHFEGGIITQIFFAEGDVVKKGDILLRIENSFAQAELASNMLELVTQSIKRQRLTAEAYGQTTLQFESAQLLASPDLITQEIRLFQTRQAEQAEKLSIIDDQVRQKQFELSEKKARLENKVKEKALMAERLASLRSLSKQGAVSRNEVLQNETVFQQVLSQIADLEHQIPRTASALEEVRGRRREAVLTFAAHAENDLADTENMIAKLDETIAALRDRKQRFDVPAPTTGTINKLFISNINGVVRPGQNIAEIVPEGAPIEVEAKLSPQDRARIWPGLPSIVKVSAYDYAIHGGLQGRIVEISPDALKDDDGKVYFRVRIEADAQGFGADKPVVPGMLADVDIISGQHTIMSYLLKPIRTVGARALRE